MNIQTDQPNQTSGNTSLFAMISLTSLFFMWGFITSLNDVLIPHLKAVFSLTYTQAMLVQFCFFSAYFLISIPAGKLVSTLGYQKGICSGLVTASVGCALFIPAAVVQEYWIFLSALFVLASGITILQVAANPLVTLMGNAKTASSRLTLTQAFNSLGATLGPFIGGLLLFSEASGHGTADNASSVVLPYACLAGLLLLLTIIFLKIKLGQQTNKPQTSNLPSENSKSLFKFRHLMLGTLGIFVYVGAEVSIGSFLVNFLGEKHIAGMTESVAAGYVSLYWLGALVGRFIGAAIMMKVVANRLLTFNGMVSVALLALVITSSGDIAVWAVLLVGLCNSIMFPTIFSLALQGLGALTSKASGLLCLAIVGGAIVPLGQGLLADTLGLQASFILPLVCYAYIAFYGFSGYVPNKQTVNET